MRTKQSLGLEAASVAMEAGRLEAETIGVPMCIAIVDESGALLAFARMDGAPLLSVGIATDKAYTASASKLSTNRLAELVANDPPLLASLANVPRMTLFAGGEVVVEAGGQIVGAVGVSGGHHSEDQRVANAAIEALGLNAP